MNYKLINNILWNLRDLDSNINLNYIESIDNDGDLFRIFKVKGEENLYLKVLEYSDSYTDNTYVYRAEFVKAKEVQKIEYINID